MTIVVFGAETDFKPLATIARKGFAYTPPRVQRLFLKMQKYDLRLELSPGKEQRTVSGRHTLPGLLYTWTNATYDQKETAHVIVVKRSFPVSEEMWKKTAQATIKDEVLQKNY